MINRVSHAIYAIDDVCDDGNKNSKITRWTISQIRLLCSQYRLHGGHPKKNKGVVIAHKMTFKIPSIHNSNSYAIWCD